MAYGIYDPYTITCEILNTKYKKFRIDGIFMIGPIHFRN